MKWFDRWFAKHAERAWNTANNKRDYDSSVGSRAVLKSRGVGLPVDRDLESRSSVTFRFHSATNGTVAQVSWFDSARDMHESELYIINSDADFGNEVASIALQHRLRHG
jgi:hypothetical protein